MQIQIKAMPANGVNGNRKGKRLSQVDNLNVCKGDMIPPRIPYEPTNKDKMCFKAITFMKVCIFAKLNLLYEPMRFTHSNNSLI